MAKKLAVVLIGILGISLCLAGVYRWHYPYGHRPCRMPCAASALWLYAHDHDGWFPKDGKTPLESLSAIALSNTSPHSLAGVSGDTKEVVRRFSARIPIDESVSSWVYWPGFRNNDDDRIAILWERAPGVGGNGRRSNDPGSHWVAFVTGTIQPISGKQWPAFLKEQELLRQEAISKRASAIQPPPRNQEGSSLNN